MTPLVRTRLPRGQIGAAARASVHHLSPAPILPEAMRGYAQVFAGLFGRPGVEPATRRSTQSSSRPRSDQAMPSPSAEEACSICFYALAKADQEESAPVGPGPSGTTDFRYVPHSVILGWAAEA